MTNSTSTRKPTQRDNFNEIRQILVDGGYPDRLIEFIDGRLAQIDKKNTAERKPTAKQVENAELSDAILGWMELDHLYSVAEIAKTCPALVERGISAARVTPMLTKLKDAGKVIRTEDKRKAFYSLA